MTKISSLWVDMGLNVGPFISGARKAAGEAGTLAGKMQTKLGKSLKQLDKELGNVSKHLGVPFVNAMKKAGAKVQTMAKKMGAAVKNHISLALKAATVAAGAFIVQSIKLAAQLEKTTVSWEVLLKSGAAAKAMLADLRQFAASTPFQFGDIEDTARMLKATGFAAKDVMGSIQMLGTVAAAVGKPLSQIAVNYSQIRSNQVAYTVDLKQFAMAGIPIWQKLADNLGVSTKEVRKLAEQSKISFGDVQLVFQQLTESGGDYYGMLEKQSQTAAGKFSTMKDAFVQMMTAFGEAILDSANFQETIDGLTNSFNALAESLKLGGSGIGGGLAGVAKMAGFVNRQFENVMSTASLHFAEFHRIRGGLRKGIFGANYGGDHEKRRQAVESDKLSEEAHERQAMDPYMRRTAKVTGGFMDVNARHTDQAIAARRKEEERTKNFATADKIKQNMEARRDRLLREHQARVEAQRRAVANVGTNLGRRFMGGGRQLLSNIMGGDSMMSSAQGWIDNQKAKAKEAREANKPPPQSVFGAGAATLRGSQEAFSLINQHKRNTVQDVEKKKVDLATKSMNYLKQIADRGLHGISTTINTLAPPV